METIREHFQTYSSYYIVGALVVLPPLIFFRKRTLPLIMYAVEFCVYAVIMHVVVYVLAVSTAWFREQTQMQAVVDVIRSNPGWKTPILRFWETSEYKPEWLYKFELAVLVIIFIAMWRYRPMVVQKKKKKAPPKKKTGSATSFGGKTQFGGKK